MRRKNKVGFEKLAALSAALLLALLAGKLFAIVVQKPLAFPAVL